METKTKRIINAAFWAAIAIAITIYVCIVWHNMGCEVKSLIAAIFWYMSAPAALCAVFDATIQGK